MTNSGTDKLIMILGIPIRIDRSAYYKKFCSNIVIEDNKIVIDNFNGGSYGCNPKYITEELLKRNKNYDIVWLVKSVKNEIEKGYFPCGNKTCRIRNKTGIERIGKC